MMESFDPKMKAVIDGWKEIATNKKIVGNWTKQTREKMVETAMLLLRTLSVKSTSESRESVAEMKEKSRGGDQKTFVVTVVCQEVVCKWEYWWVEEHLETISHMLHLIFVEDKSEHINWSMQEKAAMKPWDLGGSDSADYKMDGELHTTKRGKGNVETGMSVITRSENQSEVGTHELDKKEADAKKREEVKKKVEEARKKRAEDLASRKRAMVAVVATRLKVALAAVVHLAMVLASA